ncbi:MAG: ATP-binding protein [Phycisphaerae bacterium]
MQVIQGPDKGRSFELQEGENVVGRANCDIKLSDRTVSRNHSRLRSVNNQWILEDMGSANGTFLNGVRIKKPSAVYRGDQIRCGTSLMVFGGDSTSIRSSVDIDEEGNLVDAAIVDTLPSNEDSVIIATPEAGKEAISNLRIVYDLITDISSIFEVDRLLQRVLDKIFDLVEADRGFVLLIPEDGGLELKASRVREDSEDEEIPISQTIVNEVISQEVGILSSNAMSDKRFAAGKSVHDFGIRSAICVPIKGRERILGVIHLDTSIGEHTYTREQLRLLTAIGYHLGMAVENVHLYEAAVQSERLAAVGETVAFLSHHIKNILQALSSGIDLVEMGLKAEQLDRAKSAWPIVQRNLGRINDLILNMLAFSKDRQPLLENVNVNSVIEDCLELEQSRADEKGVALLSDLDDLPAIPLDASGLQQALLNLITNAVDAVEKKTGAVTVSSSYDSMNRNVIVKVSDNGSGIPEDKLDSIFTPFFSSKGQKGTGLGLAVAQKVIKEHHGSLDVESTVDEGTTFTMKLPSMPMGESGETTGPAR